MTGTITIPPLLASCIADGAYGELQGAAEAIVSIAESPQRTLAALAEPCERVAAQRALLESMEQRDVPVVLLAALTAACGLAEDTQQAAYSEGARLGKGERWAREQEGLLAALEGFAVLLGSERYEGVMSQAEGARHALECYARERAASAPDTAIIAEFAGLVDRARAAGLDTDTIAALATGRRHDGTP